MKQRLTIHEKARYLADDLDFGEWPEDLEPQEVAWLLRELLKLCPPEPVKS